MIIELIVKPNTYFKEYPPSNFIKIMIKNIFKLIACCCIISCQSPNPLSESALKDLTAFKTKLSKNRIKYLELCGLYKLNYGEVYTFGSDNSADFVSQSLNCPKFVGKFNYSSPKIFFTALTTNPVSLSNGTLIKSTEIKLDENGSSEKMFMGALSWKIITHSGSPYLRIWDNDNPLKENFNGYESYPPSSAYIFNANFRYYDQKETQLLDSKLGTKENANFIGQLSFEKDGVNHTLDVAPNGFLMVADLTSGNETYGAGRYMYIELPKANGDIILDFNYLYNPPCAYSEFTTCLFAPHQNRLPFEIKSGEKIALNKS